MPLKPMRRLIQIFAIALCMICAACRSESLPPENSKDALKTRINAAKIKAANSRGPGVPALWKLSDTDTVIYLFGTIHNLPDNTAWTSDQIEVALSASDTLYLETDLTSEKARKALDEFRSENGQLPTGQTLYEHLDVGDAYRLKTSVKDLGHNPKTLQFDQPWLAALRVSQMRMERSGFKASLGIDKVLENKALTAGQDIRFLEDIEDQLGLFNSASFDEQIDTLASLAFDIETTKTEMKLVSNEWLDGDVTGLGLLVANPDIALSKRSYNAILKERNLKWAAQIQPILERPGTVFMAVGAAHLAGPDSLIGLLKTQGLNIERVQ